MGCLEFLLVWPKQLYLEDGGNEIFGLMV